MSKPDFAPNDIANTESRKKPITLDSNVKADTLDANLIKLTVGPFCVFLIIPDYCHFCNHHCDYLPHTDNFPSDLEVLSNIDTYKDHK